MSEGQEAGVLDLNVHPAAAASTTVRDILLSKHPVAQEVDIEALVTTSNDSDDSPSVHSVMFNRITGKDIRLAALRIQGSAEPSE